MNAGEITAIISSILAVGGVIFQAGQSQSRFIRTEKDVDNLGRHLRETEADCHAQFEYLRKEVELLKQQSVLNSEKIRCMEDHGG
jgi:hypothetical protein